MVIRIHDSIYVDMHDPLGATPLDWMDGRRRHIGGSDPGVRGGGGVQLDPSPIGATPGNNS
jgi:hypothetical protein